MSGEAKELTLFEKIANHQIPSTIVYEDDQCCAFRDINPCAPVHIIVVPKVCGNLTQLRYMREDQEQLVGHLMRVATIVAMQEKLEPGYRIVINDGPDAQQTVFHLHIHVIGGKKCGWPPV
ncbi:hypothetical protein WA171_000256 [Blastocystis sp. BT1]